MITRPTTIKTATLKDLYDYSRYPVKISNLNTKRYRDAYDRQFPETSSDLEIEMWCAARRLDPEKGGLGEFGHYKLIMQMLYPYLRWEWHHWLDMQLSLWCGPCGTHTMLGGGSIGKSWFFGTFSRIWQATNPTMRGVMIINTTQKSQNQRAWKYVIDASQAFPFLPGILASLKTEPTLVIYSEVQDPRNPKNKVLQMKPGVGIISQTVKKGSSAQATADLKGLHPPELAVILEECNHLRRPHIERGRSNWITNAYYQVIATGNPEIGDSEDDAGKEDSLYHLSTPIHGWGSIEWGKDRSWNNKFGGRTLHFDPYDSPRIHAPKRFIVSKWLPNREFIEKKASELGGETSQLFKQQIRGIYDHESLPFNPITLSMCHKFKVSRQANFTGMARQRWAGFDPAYSGADEAFLKIAESGLTDENRIVVDFLGEKTNFSFRIDANSGDEPSFQMLKWVKHKLQEWEVPPENFIMDANIIGIGLGDIFSAYLSKKINKIIVTGQASDEYIDLGETHTAKQQCFNKATELWLAFQKLIITGQIAGLDESIINQLIEMRAEIVNGKIKTMDKKKFRAQFGYSPDRAETCLFIIDMIRGRGLKQGFSDEMLQSNLDPGGMDLSNMKAEDVFVMMGGRPDGTTGDMFKESSRQFGLKTDGVVELQQVIRNLYGGKTSIF